MGALIARVARLYRVECAAGDKDADALRLGLVGASDIAVIAAVAACGKRRDVVLQAVAGRVAAKSARFARKHCIATAHATVEALLLDQDIDAVYISVPTEHHLEYGLRALNAGKHVLMEKPLALSAAEARRLQSAARRNGRVLMEAMHWRHHFVAHRLREIAQSGEIGTLRSIHVRFAKLDLRAHGLSTAGAYSDAQRRHKMLDRWIYCVDAARFLAGPSHSIPVIADVRHVRDAGFVFEGAFALRAESDADAVDVTFVADSQTWNPLPRWEITIEGDAGRAFLQNFNFPFIYHYLEVQPHQNSNSNRGSSSGSSRTEKHYGPRGESTFELQMAAFAQAVRAGSKVVGDSASSDAVGNLDLADALRARAALPQVPTCRYRYVGLKIEN